MTKLFIYALQTEAGERASESERGRERERPQQTKTLTYAAALFRVHISALLL